MSDLSGLGNPPLRSYPAGSIPGNIRSETPTLMLGYDSWGTEVSRLTFLSVPTRRSSRSTKFTIDFRILLTIIDPPPLQFSIASSP
jgi:hypothetical protein